MRFFRWLFRREPEMREAFRLSIGYHVMATTKDGVGTWEWRG